MLVLGVRAGVKFLKGRRQTSKDAGCNRLRYIRASTRLFRSRFGSHRTSTNGLLYSEIIRALS